MRKSKLYAAACIGLSVIMMSACSNGKSKSEEKSSQQVTVNQNLQEKKAEVESIAAEEAEEEANTVEAVKFDVKPNFDENDNVTTAEQLNATITLSDDGTMVDGTGAQADGSTIKIESAGAYKISGKLSDGQLKINVKEEGMVHVILDGVSVSNKTTCPFYIKNGEKVVVTLAEGSVNTFTDSESYTVFDDEEAQEPNAAVFSKADVTFNGTGTLQVTASYNHAIRGKDGLKIMSGSYELNAASHGISGKDYVAIADGEFNITSGGDGMKSTNTKDASLGYIYIGNGTYQIEAGTDGIQARTCMLVEDGTFSVTTGGGSANASVKQGNDRMPGKMWGNSQADAGADMQKDASTENKTDANTQKDESADNKTDVQTSTLTENESCKGLKAEADITVKNGTFTLDSADDAIHSNGSVDLQNGTWNISAGDDGLHGDGAVVIAGGNMDITKSYEAIEGCSITIDDGKMNMVASDDGFNAAGGNDDSANGGGWGADQFAEDEDAFIMINGGTIHVDAGGDGVDSNGKLTFAGGKVYVDGPTNGGNAAIDANGEIAMNGGEVVAAGSSDMLEYPSENSKQNILIVQYGSYQQAGKKVVVKNDSGKEVFSYTPSKQFSCVIISDEGLKTGKTYTVETDGQKNGEFTINNAITTLGSDGTVKEGAQGGMGGQMPGGMQGGRGGNKGKGPGGQMPGGNTQNGDGQDGNMPSGQMPDGEMPTGEMPGGQMPDGEMPTGEMPDGEMPNGQMPGGQMSDDKNNVSDEANSSI